MWVYYLVFPGLDTPSFFPQAELCCPFSPHCHSSHSTFVHLKVNALLGTEILFQENKRPTNKSFTKAKVNCMYKKALTKICLFANPVVLQPKTFLCCC